MGSTLDAMARLYSCYDRLAAFFNSEYVGVRAGRDRLSNADWTAIGHLLGVLRGARELSARRQSAADHVSLLLVWL